MRKLMKKLEDMMVAVTFAESGEYDDAARYLGDSDSRSDEETGKHMHDVKKPAYEVPRK